MPTDSNEGIIEVFRQGQEPFQRFILDDKASIMNNEDTLTGTGGLLLN